MTEELVSIVIPSLNAARFITKALESVKAQTYQRWEVVVVNDGGTDNTPNLVSKFSQSVAQPVHLVTHVQNQGLSAARNSGIKTANGTYIAFVDADDFWLPEHLESLCAILRAGKADLAYSDCYVFRETSTGEVEQLPIESIEITDPGKDLFRRNFINPSGAAFTRRLAEKVGEFDRNFRAVNDLDYWMRVATHGFQIVGTGRQTYYYRKVEGSLSAHSAGMAEEHARVYEKHRQCGLLPEWELVHRASECFFAAGKLYWRKDPAAARRNFYKSWMLNRRRASSLLWYLLTPALSFARRA